LNGSFTTAAARPAAPTPDVTTAIKANQPDVYPNPFSSVVTLRWQQVPINNCPVRITAYNADGSQVAIIRQDNHMSKGSYTMEWKTDGLLVGQYIVEFEINHQK
jgi:hypothetical protein